MKTLHKGGPEPRTERYATQLLHDEPNIRVIAFHLLAGQSVPPHENDSTVVLQVVEGSALFRGNDGEAMLSAGMGVVYAPGELHSIVAVDGPLRFHAFISPSPSR